MASAALLQQATNEDWTDEHVVKRVLGEVIPPPPPTVPELPNDEAKLDLPLREQNALLLAADAKFVLVDDPAALDLARQVVHQRLGLGNDNADES